ncbi:MAG: extracellular solute-binding protein, partial [Saccharofermentanales bacterium]
MQIKKFIPIITVCLAAALIVSATACNKATTATSDILSSALSGITSSEAVSGEDSSQSGQSGASDISNLSGVSAVSGEIISESSSASSSSAGGINTKPTNAVTPGATGFVKPKYDLKGKVIVIWGASQPKSGSIEYESWKEVEKEYNCILKFVKVTYSVAVAKQTAAALSGTSECDVWFTQWYDVFPSFVAKGMVAPLSDYYDFANDPNWSAEDGNSSNYWNGKLYGLNSGVSGPAWGLWYNKSMLAKENLE